MDAAFDRSDNLESTAAGARVGPGGGRSYDCHGPALSWVECQCTNQWLIIRTKDGAPETYQVTFHAGFPFIGVYNIQCTTIKL